MRKCFFMSLFITLLFLLSGAASGEEAVELTKKCSFNASSGRSSFRQALDGDYRTFWSVNPGKNAYLEITLPKDQTLGGIYLQWYETAFSWSVEAYDDGEWKEVSQSAGLYYNDTLLVPEGLTTVRLHLGPEARQVMQVAELHVFSAGVLPSWVQTWEPTVEKADLMLLVAHPDDELLWFGGTLPTYAGEQGKRTLVAVLVPTVPRRRLELLDGLWTCGVRQYPIWGKYPDKYSVSLSKQYEMWNRKKLWKLVTGWVRQYKPDVLLTHDIAGEYGHGAHRAAADACIHAVQAAADASMYTDTLDFGTWDVPKFYIHLYSENTIEMDWRQPLSAFDGRTGFDVAVAAFDCHVSQRRTDYAVKDSGKTSCALFGLYRTLVGEDVEKNDFFEHIQ